MADEREYVLKITGYTPKTLPLARLLEYLAPLVQIFGNTNGVHLSEIREGSAELVTTIDAVVGDDVDRRVALIDSPDAPPEVMDGVDDLNEQLRADKRDAVLLRRAANDNVYLEVRTFRGAAEPSPKAYGPYPQPTTIDAFLHRAGGKKPRLTLIDPERKRIPAECTEETLKELRHHLHEWLRLHGEGRWYRTARGKWELWGFTVTHFEPVANESLVAAVDRMRAIRGTEWERMKDPLGELRNMRRDDDEAR